MRVTLDEALGEIARVYGFDPKEVNDLADMDWLGGCDDVFPEGSIWRVEGVILYTLVRLFKPDVIVEVGTFAGCSTNHLALACQHNDRGVVHSVDINPHAGSMWERELRSRIVKHTADALSWLPPAKCDFVFEDGCHEYVFTKLVWQRLKPFLLADAVCVCRGYENEVVGPHVSRAWCEELGTPDFACLPGESDCGIAIKVYEP